MYNILIPTDFSENARKAVNYAIWLFQGTDVSLFIYNAYGTNRSDGSMLISIDDILKKEADEKMAKEMARIEDLKSTEMKVNGFVRNCTLTSYIHEVINDWDIDLIIMGTKGETGIKGKLMGSNASSVIRKVDIPIITVPGTTVLDDGGEFNIAFGTDLKPFKGRDQIAKMIDAMNTDTRKVHLELFYISPEKTEIREESRNYMDQLCSSGNCQYMNIVDDSIEKGLEHYIDTKKPDLLMLVQRRDSFINRILGNSISHSMLMKAELPMIVLHDVNS